MPPRDIIIEQVRIGSALKIIAIDADTGVEAVFQAPVTASKLEIQRLAVNKINYVLNKQNKI